MQPRWARAAGFRPVRVPTPAGPVHVLEAAGTGELPPFLLLHGIGSRAADWAVLLGRIAPLTRRVIAPDLPGHGESPVPAGGMSAASVREAMRAALLERVTEPAIVIGNSLGGVAALSFAAAHPERVRALVLVSPGGAPMSHEELFTFTRQFRMHRQADAVAFVERVMAAPTWTRHLVAVGVRARIRRRPIQEFLGGLSPEDLLTAAEVAALQVPTLCLWGRADNVLPPSHREFFRTHLPAGAAFEEPDGFGHAPFLDDPVGFTDRIAAFARGVVARGG